MPIIKDGLLGFFIDLCSFRRLNFKHCLSRAASCYKLTLIVFIVLAVSTSTNAQESVGLTLSAAEHQWIQEHNEVIIGYDGHSPPYSFINNEQQLEGYSVDLFKILANKTGLSFSVYPQYMWEQVYAAARAHEIDVVASMVENQDRLQWFNFTQPYVFKSQVIISREDDTSINDKADIKNKTVALVKSYHYKSKLIENYPTITLLYFDTILDALNAVSVGEADIAITFFGAGHFLRNKYLLTNLKYAAIYDRDTANERIAIRNDLPLLSTILDKALASITEAQYQKIRSKWLPMDDMEELAEIELTPMELSWIKAHPDIRLGVDPEYAPFEYVDEQRYKGMASDYIKLLNQRLKLNMRVSDNLSWTEVVNKIKKKELDVLPVVSITAQRSKFLSFTLPYLNFYRVIVTRVEMPFISGLNDLGEKIVAAQKNTSHYEFLIQNSDIDPVLYADLKQSLLAVSSGKADAYVGNVAAVTYWIRKLNLTNLKIAAPASTEIQGLRFGVRKDWPELISILQKGLNSISGRQKKVISEKWLSIDYNPGMSARLIWKIIGIAALLVLAVMIWNIILNRKVKLRTSQLIYNANYDKLTDLPNRFLTLDRLNQKITEAQIGTGQIAVISIYINDFKTINNVYGHQTGDDILRIFALRLKSSLREHQLVGRLSGNKFLMIQSHVQDCIESASLAEQILECSEKPFTAGLNNISLDASLGITLFPDDGEDAELLLKRAGTATQHAKNKGRGGYIYYTERLNSNVARKLAIETQLRSAIECNELEVYFQPKLDPITVKAISFEALLRWNSKELGFVSPTEFIPIAESYGIIKEIGLFVIKQALSTLQQLQNKYGFEFSIAINLSPVQFYDEDLLPNIEQLLNKYKLKPSSVEFEITEGVLLSELSGIEDKLRKLESLGVSLAMDDFGTGYSSLSYLRKYRFDTLKIDQEFIAGLPHSISDKKLVTAIIVMAHELDMIVVAEGVETAQQHAFLVEQKCDLVQGWLFSNALNVTDVNAYLDQQFLICNSLTDQQSM
ncbi:MAG: transporter substrate-binding domain-containing protein [Oceanospirillaceae bacterium]